MNRLSKIRDRVTAARFPSWQRRLKFLSVDDAHFLLLCIDVCEDKILSLEAQRDELLQLAVDMYDHVPSYSKHLFNDDITLAENRVKGP